MKRWWLLALLAAVFVVLGAVLLVALGRVDPVGYVAGGVFLLVGLGMAFPAWSMRREESLDRVAAPDATPGGIAWGDVAERIRARFAGTPYVVEAEGSVIRVRADLADATFLTWAQAHHVRDLRWVEVVAKEPGRAITRDVVQGLDVSGGVGRLTGSARVQSGRSWSYTRRIEYGVGTDGSVGRQVDIDFRSSDIQGPVDEVLKETGWYTGWWGALPAEAKGAVVMAAVGGIGAIVAVVAVLVVQVA